MNSSPNMGVTDDQRKRLNLFRYGMMVIPVVAWLVAFAPVFLVSNGMGQNWISDALIPSLIVAVVVGVICFLIFQGYKRMVLKI